MDGFYSERNIAPFPVSLCLPVGASPSGLGLSDVRVAVSAVPARCSEVIRLNSVATWKVRSETLDHRSILNNFHTIYNNLKI